MTIPDCPRCGENKFFHIPDSLANACEKCGFVWVGDGDGMEYKPGATLQEWAKDLYELALAKERKP